MERRDFIGGLAALSLTVRSSGNEQGGQTASHGDMSYRTLGRTSEKVSCIGLGGYHLGQAGLPEAEAIKLFHAAVDRGINFSDNSWDYNNGESERRVGKALKGYREKVFVMTKFDGRTKDSALKQLDESLERLQVDYVDLWQFHENIRLEDPDRFFAPGGPLEALMEAKKAGKIRYIGFTGHKDPLVHLRMLEEARKRNVHFDTVQMPLNVMDAHFRSFAHDVLPVLVREGIAPLGMKSLGDQFVLQSKTATPIECLHYCLNLPIAVQIAGIDSQQVLDQAFEAVKTFKPMTEAQVSQILNKTREAAQAGRFEPYKTSAHFDGTAANPKWLG